MSVCERDPEKFTNKHRQTDRQTDRQINILRDRQTDPGGIR